MGGGGGVGAHDQTLPGNQELPGVVANSLEIWKTDLSSAANSLELRIAGCPSFCLDLPRLT